MAVKTASIREILATRARTTYAYRIDFETIGYETLPRMTEWCEYNCEDLWRCQSNHALYFQFAEELDAMMFMLKWGGAEGNRLK